MLKGLPECPTSSQLVHCRLASEELLATLRAIDSVDEFNEWAARKRDSGWFERQADAFMRPLAPHTGNAAQHVQQTGMQQGRHEAAAPREQMPPPAARPPARRQAQQLAQQQQQAQQAQLMAQQQQQQAAQPAAQQAAQQQQQTPQHMMLCLLSKAQTYGQAKQVGLTPTLVSQYLVYLRQLQTEAYRQLEVEMLLPFLLNFDEQVRAAPGSSSGEQRLPDSAVSTLEAVAGYLKGVVSTPAAGAASHAPRPQPQPSATVDQGIARS